MNSTVVKIIIVISLLVFSTFAISSTIETFDVQEDESMTLTFKLDDFDQTFFYLLPSNAHYNNIDIISHNYIKEQEETPSVTFYTTNEDNPDIIIKDCPKTQSYYSDLLKKGNFDLIRLYIPSTYYSSDYKYTTTSITLQINYQTEPKSLVTQKDLQKVGTIIDNSEVLKGYATQQSNFNPQNPDYDYLIITNESFYDLINENYKDWKINNDNKINSILIVNVSTILNQTNCSINGTWGDATNTSNGNPWIEDGKEVTSDYEMFNDSQAKIRNYIRYCYTTHNTRYVLLFGNSQVIPPRMVCSYAAGTCPGCTGFYNDTSHASDMYYSNLHYNMNNNTNSYWMENAVCGSPVDEIDWGYDVHLGRVLINQKWETLWWINKTKNYITNNQSNYTQWNVVPCRDNGGAISNQTWTGWQGSQPGPGIGDEFPDNISFINNQNITATQWSNLDDYANGNAGGIPGFVLIYHAGHGGTLWDPYSDVNLDNMDFPNFVITEGCSSADFGEDTSSRMEDWMSDNGAAFGGVANSAYGWFVASTYYGEQMMRELFNDSNTSILCEAFENSKEVVGHDPDCVWGQIVKDSNFFGDPAQEWVWYDPSVNTTNTPQFVNISNGLNGTTITSPTIIFNWTKIENATQYHLQISYYPDFSVLVTNISNISSPLYPSYYSESNNNVSFELPPEYELSLYDTYYCRVRSYVRS